MQPGDLIPGAELPELAGRTVTALAFDSRKVVPGALFFAIPGVNADGLGFAGAAIAQGALAIVAERHALAGEGGAWAETIRNYPVPVIAVDNVRAALSRAAAAFFPMQPRTIAAVTGTSGKTSVAAFLRQIWLACGRQAASVGTIGVVAPAGAVYGSLTTPDPVTLHETLERLAGGGVTHLAIEASSHGLDQHRLDGVRLAAGAFTNLSRDHLDYHSDLSDYLAAKMRLFSTLLRPGQPAVVDADTAYADEVTAILRARGLDIISAGSKGETIRLLARDAQGLATRLSVGYADSTYNIHLPLAGAFQTANALVAAGLAIACGEQARDVFAALETLEGAPGRLELIGRAGGGAAFVDYAHKADGLATALASLRPFVQGRLIVVFGCGGDRDRGKRAIMGEIAARDADYVIITDDNPRSEDPALIRRAIMEGANGQKHARVQEIGDRGAAIAAAVAMMNEGDIVLVAGKGHEAGQITGSQTLPFSDHEAVCAALAVRLARGAE